MHVIDHFTPSNVATSARRPTAAHLSFLRYSLYLFVLFTTHIICSVPFQLRYITRFTTIPVSLVCCFIHAFVAERLALFLLGRPSTSRQGTYFTRLHVSVSARLSFLKRQRGISLFLSALLSSSNAIHALFITFLITFLSVAVITYPKLTQIDGLYSSRTSS